MILERIVVGPLEANCYFIGCSQGGEVAIVDPGADHLQIFNLINSQQYKPLYIINTHCHIDHTGANAEIKRRYKIPILIHQDDAPYLSETQDSSLQAILSANPSPPADRLLTEDDFINIGSLTLEVIHTPGHSPGGICLKFPEGVLTGDTLFYRGIGRTDLPGGSYPQLIESVKNKLFALDKSLPIYPGHGPTSTIGEEMEENPFF
ncbi:MBL fold metallo-hydrolase [bacterium (candidate division B38) B3_B38]|nr:MAG: MBL fold metallo-hydrolase [bacterium (candidate division B38) B3_B38]